MKWQIVTLVGAIVFLLTVALLPKPIGTNILLTALVICFLGLPLYGMFAFYLKDQGLKTALYALFSTLFALAFWHFIVPTYCHRF
jgi:hypothetical protein